VKAADSAIFSKPCAGGNLTAGFFIISRLFLNLVIELKHKWQKRKRPAFAGLLSFLLRGLRLYDCRFSQDWDSGKADIGF